MRALRWTAAVTLFAVACAPSVEPARRPDAAKAADAVKADAVKAEPVKADAAKADAAKATGTPLLSLQRGACFGRCPVYRVQVYDDGTLEFVGERFVASLGTSSAQLDAAALATLRARVEGSSFSRWKQRYTRPTVTDLPTVQLSWKGRTIVHAQGDRSAPPDLTRLEDDLDVLLDTARWITSPGPVDR